MRYKVYVKTNENSCVIDVNSSGFLSDAEGWTQIDEGSGDRFYLAQGNYFADELMDERGVYRYKLADGKAVERTQAEMDADYVEFPEALTLEAEAADMRAALALLGVTL